MILTNASVTREKFVNQSDVIRASIRKTLDMLDERHGRIGTGDPESNES